MRACISLISRKVFPLFVFFQPLRFVRLPSRGGSRKCYVLFLTCNLHSSRLSAFIYSFPWFCYFLMISLYRLLVEIVISEFSPGFRYSMLRSTTTYVCRVQRNKKVASNAITNELSQFLFKQLIISYT